MTLSAAHFSSQLCLATDAVRPHSSSLAAQRAEHSAAGTGVLPPPLLPLLLPPPELDEPEPELDDEDPEDEDVDVPFVSSEDPHPTKPSTRGRAVKAREAKRILRW